MGCEKRLRRLSVVSLSAERIHTAIAVRVGQVLEVLVGVGYLSSRPTAEDVSIEEIRTEYDDDPVAVLTVRNPVSATVRVSVDVWIADTSTNWAGDRYTNSVSKTVERSLPPNSATDVQARFGDEKTDFGDRNPESARGSLSTRTRRPWNRCSRAGDAGAHRRRFRRPHSGYEWGYATAETGRRRVSRRDRGTTAWLSCTAARRPG
jgi:hypothetical protein